MTLVSMLALDPHEIAPRHNPFLGARRLIAAVVVQAVQDAHSKPVPTPSELLEARRAAAQRAACRNGRVGKTAQFIANRAFTKAWSRHEMAKRFGLQDIAVSHDQCAAFDFLLTSAGLNAYLEFLDIDPSAFRARVMDGCGALTGWQNTTSVANRRKWFGINLQRWRQLRSLPPAIAGVAIYADDTV